MRQPYAPRPLRLALTLLLTHLAYATLQTQTHLVCKQPSSQSCLSWKINLDQVSNIRNKAANRIAVYCGLTDQYTKVSHRNFIQVKKINEVTSSRKSIYCDRIIEINSPFDWNKVTNAFKRLIRVRRQSLTPRGRFRGQTQSQYLTIDRGTGKDEGKAEAHSAADSSRASVSGNSGMGQAQSQSVYDPNCDDCNGRSNHEVENLRRPNGYKPVDGGYGPKVDSTWPGKDGSSRSYNGGYNPTDSYVSSKGPNYYGPGSGVNENSLYGPHGTTVGPSNAGDGRYRPTGITSDSYGPGNLPIDSGYKPINSEGDIYGPKNNGYVPPGTSGGDYGHPILNGLKPSDNSRGYFPSDSTRGSLGPGTNVGYNTPNTRNTAPLGPGKNLDGTDFTMYRPQVGTEFNGPGYNGRNTIGDNGKSKLNPIYSPGTLNSGTTPYRPDIGSSGKGPVGFGSQTGLANWPLALGPYLRPDGSSVYCCVVPNTGQTFTPYGPYEKPNNLISPGNTGLYNNGPDSSRGQYIPGGITGAGPGGQNGPGVTTGLGGQYRPGETPGSRDHYGPDGVTIQGGHYGPGGNVGAGGQYGPGGTSGPGVQIGQGGITGPTGQYGPGGLTGPGGQYGPGGITGPGGQYGSSGSTRPGENIGQGEVGGPGGHYVPGGIPGQRGPIGQGGTAGPGEQYGPGGTTGQVGPIDQAGTAGPGGQYGPGGTNGQGRPIGQEGTAIPGGQYGPDGITGQGGPIGQAGMAIPGGQYGPGGMIGQGRPIGQEGTAGPRVQYGPGGPTGQGGPIGQVGTAGPGGQYGPGGGNIGVGGQYGPGGTSGPGGQSGQGGLTGPGNQYGSGGTMEPGGHYGSGGTTGPMGQYEPGGITGPGGHYGPGGVPGASGLYGPGGIHGPAGQYRPGGLTEIGGQYGPGGTTGMGKPIERGGSADPGVQYESRGTPGQGSIVGPGGQYGLGGIGGPGGLGGQYGPGGQIGQGSMTGPGGQYGPGGQIGQGGMTGPGGQYRPGGITGPGGQYRPGEKTGPGRQIGQGGISGPEGQYGPGGTNGPGGQIGPGGMTGPGGQYGPGGQIGQGAMTAPEGQYGSDGTSGPGGAIGQGGITTPGGQYVPSGTNGLGQYGPDGATGPGAQYRPGLGGIAPDGRSPYGYYNQGGTGEQTNEYSGVPQNYVDPNSIVADGDDSEAEASVAQNINGTTANAASKGGNDKGRAQTSVQGTYTGSGSFQAQAQITGENKEAQSEVSGGKKGASSSASGSGRNNKSQANVQLGSETGSIQTQSQSNGVMHSSQSQVQGGVKGGMADAQARGPGSTSSQAQIGFTPFKDEEKSTHDLQKIPYVGGGMASAQSSGRTGQSQSQLHGTFKYGITYNGAAQSGASIDKDAVFPNRLSFEKIDVFDESDKNINIDKITSDTTETPQSLNTDQVPLETSTILDTFNNKQITEIPTTENIIDESMKNSESRYSGHPHSNHHNSESFNSTDQYGSTLSGSRRSFQTNYANPPEYEFTTDKDDNQPEYDTEVGYDGDGNEANDVEQTEYSNYDEYTRDPATHQYLQNPSRKGIDIQQTSGGNTQHIVLGSLKNHNAEIIQKDSERPDENKMYQPGERIPGTGGYIIPAGFTGSVKSVASKDKTYVIGSKDSPSQAQTVTLTPGTGKVRYSHPYKNYVKPKNLRSLNNPKDNDNRYVSVSKSVTRALDSDNNIRKQYSHTYYTKSSSCGYFTFTCTMVSSAEGRKKVCRPKMPTNPDGTPIRC